MTLLLHLAHAHPEMLEKLLQQAAKKPKPSKKRKGAKK